MDFAFLDGEIDHTAGRDELVGFAHRQNAGVAQGGENFRQIIFQTGADEQDVTVHGVVYGVELLDFKAAIFHLLIADGVLEVVAKNVFPQHANDDGRIGLRERLRRPIHKFGKIEQEGRLDLILRRGFLREASGTEYQA